MLFCRWSWVSSRTILLLNLGRKRKYVALYPIDPGMVRTSATATVDPAAMGTRLPPVARENRSNISIRLPWAECARLRRQVRDRIWQRELHRAIRARQAFDSHFDFAGRRDNPAATRGDKVDHLLESFVHGQLLAARRTIEFSKGALSSFGPVGQGRPAKVGGGMPPGPNPSCSHSTISACA